MMSEDEARAIVAATRRSIAAHLKGGIRSEDPKVRADARLMSLQDETLADRRAARRRLQSVTDDMSAEEYREYFRAKRARLEKAMAARRSIIPNER